MTDPFAVLGLEPTMDLSRDALDESYHAKSRATHPDHLGGADESGALAESAAVNDAYRRLRDPWKRAEALVERGDPGAMERKKQLCPMFLMEAMELAEQVAEADPSDFTKLRQKLERRRTGYLDQLRESLTAGRFEDAAVQLHESRYCRKALLDLEEREHPI